MAVAQWGKLPQKLMSNPEIRYKHLMVQLIEVLMIPIELQTERASLWFYTDVLFDQDS